jgi:hypothetical protein
MARSVALARSASKQSTLMVGTSRWWVVVQARAADADDLDEGQDVGQVGRQLGADPDAGGRHQEVVQQPLDAGVAHASASSSAPRSRRLVLDQRQGSRRTPASGQVSQTSTARRRSVSTLTVTSGTSMGSLPYSAMSGP